MYGFWVTARITSHIHGTVRVVLHYGIERSLVTVLITFDKLVQSWWFYILALHGSEQLLLLKHVQYSPCRSPAWNCMVLGAASTISGVDAALHMVANAHQEQIRPNQACLNILNSVHPVMMARLFSWVASRSRAVVQETSHA